MGETEKRRLMVEQQIVTRGVKNESVLEAMRKVERHRFVPESIRPVAYRDEPQPIGKGQTISQPYIVALMTEILDPKPTDRVLEVGSGCGYQTAVLAEIVKHVYSLEIVPELAENARENLERLGYRNVTVRQGNGYEGWPGEAPFDKIMVTAAPPETPQALIAQLAPGGRMAIPVGIHYQVLYLLRKKETEVKQEEVIPVRFVPMTGGGSG